jgi:hypothetical protein
VVGILRRLRPTDPDILYTAQRIYSDLADEAMVSIAMTAPQSARTHQLMAHQLARSTPSSRNVPSWLFISNRLALLSHATKISGQPSSSKSAPTGVSP